jgi:hypothetical protein
MELYAPVQRSLPPRKRSPRHASPARPDKISGYPVRGSHMFLRAPPQHLPLLDTADLVPPSRLPYFTWRRYFGKMKGYSYIKTGVSHIGSVVYHSQSSWGTDDPPPTKMIIPLFALFASGLAFPTVKRQSGAQVLEAEDASLTGTEVLTELSGYSGKSNKLPLKRPVSSCFADSCRRRWVRRWLR